MLFRLLLVVLAVVGTIPLRICTCGALHHHAATTEAANNATQLHKTTPVTVAIQSEDGEEHHDPDCGSLNPRPAMNLAVDFEPASVADDGCWAMQHAPVTLPRTRIGLSHLHLHHHPPWPVPRHVLLLVFQI